MANLNEFRPFLRSRDEKFRKTTKFSLAHTFFFFDSCTLLINILSLGSFIF